MYQISSQITKPYKLRELIKGILMYNYCTRINYSQRQKDSASLTNRLCYYDQGQFFATALWI